ILIVRSRLISSTRSGLRNVPVSFGGPWAHAKALGSKENAPQESEPEKNAPEKNALEKRMRSRTETRFGRCLQSRIGHWLELKYALHSSDDLLFRERADDAINFFAVAKQ